MIEGKEEKSACLGCIYEYEDKRICSDGCARLEALQKGKDFSEITQGGHMDGQSNEEKDDIADDFKFADNLPNDMMEHLKQRLLQERKKKTFRAVKAIKEPILIMCLECKKREATTKESLCRQCYAKKWRKEKNVDYYKKKKEKAMSKESTKSQEPQENIITIDLNYFVDKAVEKRENKPLDLKNIYKYHTPKEGQNKKYEAIRAKAKELADLIFELCPASREQSVAFTNLETAVMWSNASIARWKPND